MQLEQAESPLHSNMPVYVMMLSLAEMLPSGVKGEIKKGATWIKAAI